MLGCAEEVAFRPRLLQVSVGPAVDQRPRAQAAARGGSCGVGCDVGGWEVEVGTWLSPRAPSQFAAASPSFPFWDQGATGEGEPHRRQPRPLLPRRI